jgi:2,4-dienoyl-CoA reductase-like NADH-dependent reductase (Old Yellow Enzyme family)
LETQEIKDLVQTYRQAAINAIEAGFDGVEIHNANGYLLDQFVNSGSNKRTDEYGGSIENRCRFSLEVVDAITKAIGEDRTAIRFSPNGGIQGMQDDAPVETWSYLISQLQKSHPNMSYIHLIEARSDFNVDGMVNTVDTLGPYREIWKGPLITAGGFSNAVEHAIALAEKTGDLISFGRAFIANPDLPERIRNQYAFNKYNRKTFYTHDAIGYTDYSFHGEKSSHL